MDVSRRLGAGNRSLQETRFMACHHRRPHRNRRHLRHELQAHAGIGMGVWLLHHYRHDPDRVRGPILALPARRMAVDHPFGNAGAAR